MTDRPDLAGLVAALTAGLIIGLERGWRARDEAEGGHVAGLRTFTLIGLLGGILGGLNPALGVGPLATGLAGVALVAAVAYREEVRANGNRSATSAIAMLLAYALGACAAAGAPEVSLGAAAVSAVLLDQKPRLHRWLRLMSHRELGATIQLLVLSVVVLPLLPDRGLGPYEALNPYRLWWAVVLVAALSLGGHVAVRAAGTHRGLILSGLLGGLVSSTATTLALSRRARQEPEIAAAAVSAGLASCAVMFVRVLAIVAALHPGLGLAVGPPLAASGLSMSVMAALYWRRRSPHSPPGPSDDASPFDLRLALLFGAFLGLLALVSRMTRDVFGTAGVYALAALAGLADVDGVAISIAHMQSAGALPVGASGVAVIVAVTANLISKAVMAWIIGGAALGRGISAGYLVAAVTGAVAGLGLLVT